MKLISELTVGEFRALLAEFFLPISQRTYVAKVPADKRDNPEPYVQRLASQIETHLAKVGHTLDSKTLAGALGVQQPHLNRVYRSGVSKAIVRQGDDGKWYWSLPETESFDPLPPTPPLSTEDRLASIREAMGDDEFFKLYPHLKPA